MRPVLRRSWPVFVSFVLTLAGLALVAAPAFLAVKAADVPVAPLAPHPDRPAHAGQAKASSANANRLQVAGTGYTQTALWSAGVAVTSTAPIRPADVAMQDETHLYVADAGSRVVWALDLANGSRERWQSGLQAVDPCTVVPVAVAVHRTAHRVLIIWAVGDAISGQGITRTVLQVRSATGALERQLEVPDITEVTWQQSTGDIFVMKDTTVRRLRWPDLAITESYGLLNNSGAGQLAVNARWIAMARNGQVELTTLGTGKSAGRLNLGEHEALAVAADRDGRIWVLVRPSRPSASPPGPGSTPMPVATPTPGPAGADTVMVFDTNGGLAHTYGAAELGVPAVPEAWWPFTLDVVGPPSVGGAPGGRAALALTSAATRIGVYAVPSCTTAACAPGGPALQGAPMPMPVGWQFSCGSSQNGELLIAPLADGGILAYNGRTSQIIRFSVDGAPGSVGSSPVSLEAMATDGDGTVFGVLDHRDNVTQSTVARFRLPPTPDEPMILTHERDCECEPGESLATDGEYVYVGRPPGKLVAILNAADLSPAGELRLAERSGLWPASVATTPDGWVWAADLLAGQVEGWAPVSRQADVQWAAGLTASPWHVAGGALDNGQSVVAAHMTDGTIELHGAADGNLLARWDPHAFGERYSVRSLALGRGGRVYLADESNGLVHVFEPRRMPAVPTPEIPVATPTPSRRTCLVEGDKVAGPPVVVLGSAARVTLTLAADCPSQQRESGADIVLVIDRSGSMEGQKLADAQEAAKAFVQFLDIRVHRVGLIAFNNEAQIVTPLTKDPAAVISGLGTLRADGGTNIAAALTTADDHLIQAGRPDALPVIVVLSDGRSMPQPALDAAFAARSRGVRIYTIGLGPDVDHALMLQIASGRYFPAPTSSELFPIYREIVRLVTLSLSGNLFIEDEMAPDIQLVSGSTVPKAIEGANDLQWGRSVLSPGGITLTYQILPLRAGRLPTNRHAVAAYTDADGVARRYTFPVPEIDVITPTPSPTLTPAPTATATRTPTPTATPRPAYVPVAVNEKCTPAQRRVDVVLVLDASGSMAESAGDGAPGSKLDAARAAAREFLGQLQFDSGDQAALVSFNSQARLLQPLTSRSADVDRALDAIALASQTRLQRGIEVATDELQSSRHRAANAKMIILLTDGRANPEPVSQAVERAAAAKAAGIIIFTVGLGTDLDRDALAEIASLRSYFFEVLDASTLSGIFVRIAGQIPCSPSQFWGRR